MYRKYIDIIFSQGIRFLAIRGFFAFGAGNVGEKSLRLLRNIVLTRILMPEAFGIMAIIMAINMALESLTQIGTNLSIIHNERGRENVFLNGAWMLSIGRALMLFVIAFMAAPWIAELYENPELITLMRVGFISILINGTMSPRAYVALKDLEYRKWVIISHGGNAIGIAFTVVLALVLTNVWALVIGFLVE
ncbi:MAG: oligosaccharide flippase family protein, partial [Syntrophales bacterium LBB04]|nr:oligosaccharide flippase family protein [Syntrophales bacterium LBB04]